ncbi:hemicentin-1 [Aplysia californica]|uniref:Hemicentin-1 n=1 Tax=Aplysia californica TaxID=6500 RepID=A0ABM1W0A2_APLCA|nr:hemicentin-1 [Aplysia californica]
MRIVSLRKRDRFFFSEVVIAGIGSRIDSWPTTSVHCPSGVHPLCLSVPPQVTKTGGDRVMSTEGTRQEISCQIQSSSPAALSVSWTRNGTAVNVNNGRYEGGTVSLPSLIIRSVSEDDQGDYVCSVTNAEGTGSFATPTTIVVRFTPVIEYPGGTSFSGSVGGQVTLPCPVQSVPLPSTIRWKRTVNGVDTYLDIAANPRYSGGTAVNQQYGLTINPLQSDDQDGVYACEADNDVSTGNGPPLTLIVNTRPTILTPAVTISGTEGQLVTLTCDVSPLDTLLDLYWTKDGARLTPAGSGRYSGGSTVLPSLTISSLVQSDTGSYVCLASNPSGTSSGDVISLTVNCEWLLVVMVVVVLLSSSLSFGQQPFWDFDRDVISLTVNHKPRLTVQNQPITTSEGATIVLACDVDASPAITNFYWTKTGQGQISPASNPGKYSGGTLTSTTLLILSADSLDSGQYICVAENSVGTTFSLQTSVTVQARPVISDPAQNNVSTSENQTVTFPCDVTPLSGLTDLYWTRDGQQINTGSSSRYSGGTVTTPSLTISSVQSGDSGSYVCVATNNFGTGSGPGINLDVNYKPSLTVRSTPIIAADGSTVALACDVDATPAITNFYWTKSGQGLISSASNPSKYSGGTLTGTTLLILSADSSDDGQYFCVAENSRGLTVSPGISLSVLATPVIDDPAQPDVILNEGQSVTVPCTVTPLNGLTDLYWTKDGQRIDPSSSSRYSGGTVTTPSLTISSVQSGDSGTYVCVATNNFGTGSGGNVNLIIPYKPRLSVSTAPITSREGGTIVLACDVDASPAITNFYWTRTAQGQINPASNPGKYSGGTLTSTTLLILSADSSDSGQYFCVAENSEGISFSPQINVTVLAPPVISNPAQPDVSTTEGQSVTLTCNVTPLTGLTDLYWTRDGQRIDPSSSSRYNGGTVITPSLTITSVQSGDSGTYVCVASNSFGTGFGGNVDLSLTYRPQLTVTDTPIITTTRAIISLTCIVDASPALTELFWTKVGVGRIEPSSSSKYSGGSVANPSLTIFSAEASDSGQYFCNALNSQGSTTSDAVSVTVNYRPLVSVQPSSASVPEATSLYTLNCDIDASPDVTLVRWSKDGVRLVVGSQQRKYLGGTLANPNLSISTITRDDAGSYACSATNSQGTGFSSTAVITVTYRPEIVSSSEAQVVVRTFSTVTLRCAVSSSPALTSFQWVKDGVSVQPEVNPGRYLGGSLTQTDLTIFTVTPTDSGLYRCQATNAVGQTSGPATQLNVYAEPTVTTPSDDVIVAEGQSTDLSCVVEPLDSLTDLYWTKDGQILDTSDASRYRGGTLVTPTLTLLSVPVTGAGVYSCVATNTFGTRSGGPVTVAVTYKPKLTVSTIPIERSIGGVIQLTCIVSANPAPTSFSWTLSGVGSVGSTVDPSKYSGGTLADPTLLIRSASSSDSGQYVCAAENAVGTSASDPVTVSVTDKPVVTVSAFSTVAPEGTSRITLLCDVTANPGATSVTWTRDGMELPVTSRPDKYTGGNLVNPSLTISDVDKSDAGDYVCSATNSLGTGVSPTSTVEVTYRPILTFDTTPVSSQPGTAVTLDCQVSAVPALSSFVWSKNGALLQTSSDPVKYFGGTVGRTSLTIFNLNTSDSGFYSCSAVNSLGSSSSAAKQLSIVTRPIVTTPQTSVNGRENNPVTLTCDVNAGAGLTDLTWSKDGLPLTTSDRSKYTGGTTSSPSLTVQSLKDSDAGVYVCLATNAQGTTRGNDISLNVQYGPRISVPSRPIIVNSGQPLTLSCSVIANPSVSELYWVKDTTGRIDPSSDSRYSGGTIAVPSLTIDPSHIDDSGAYNCVARNAVGTNSSSIALDVVNTPQLTATLATPTVEEGVASVTLECIVNANPYISSLSWNKGIDTIDIAGNPGKYSGGTIGTTSLTILSVDRDDAGSYTCSGTNLEGTGSSLPVQLVVTYRPTLNTSTTSVTGRSGEFVTLPCDVSAVPALTSFYWTKDGARLNLASPPNKYSGGTLALYALTINGLDSSSDPGAYRCVAENARGVVSSDVITLAVSPDPKISVDPSVTANQGDAQLVIRCDVTMFPPASSLLWFKNNQQLDVTSDPSKYSGGTLATPTLTVLNPDRTDSGTYRCRASNGDDTVTSPDVTVSIQCKR